MIDSLHQLGAADVSRAAQTLVQALQDDLIFRGLLPDDALRSQQLREVYQVLVRGVLLAGEAYATSAQCEGVALWLAPGRRISLWDELWRLGAARLPWRLGWRTTLRLMRCQRHLEGLRRRYAPPQHWYLQALGVEPAAQRRGLGRRLLSPMLERFDRQGSVCGLDTENRDNVEYYQRYGFEVSAESTIPGIGVRCWFMVRVPGAARHGD